MKSSYQNRNISYEEALTTLCQIQNPQRIVEFGILEGYSLEIFSQATRRQAQIQAYDIYEKFNGNGSSRQIAEQFADRPEISILEGDFYQKHQELEAGSIDLLHIDIANNGEVYEFAMKHYLPLLSPGGIMILEGGSETRDQVEWMIKYQKKPIHPVVEEWEQDSNLSVKILGTMPSFTVVKPHLNKST